MDTLPPELLLYFIPFLPLTSLIAARGVNAQWRFFAQTAPLHPTRKVLLNIYLATIIHPNFPSVVAALQHGLREFDREAYIADLTSQGCVLPDLFELWILEWPTKAVHFWAWPGLPWWPRMEDEYFEHTNFMYEAKCTIETIPVPKKEVATVGSPTCRGLLLWSIFLTGPEVEAQLWLVVDGNDKINDRRMGRLLWTYARPHPGLEFKRTKIFQGTPLANIRLIEFLNLLDFGSDQVEEMLREFNEGDSDTPLTDDSDNE